MGVDARPAIRCGLSTIIKTGPHKPAGQPRPRREVTPPRLGGVRPRRSVVVIGADVSALLVIGVDAPRAHGAALFGPNVGLSRVGFVIGIHVFADVVIPAANLDDFVDAMELVADRRGVSDRPGGIEPVGQVLKGAGDAPAGGSALDAELLIGYGPDKNAGMVPITPNEA